jgi:hypothetical protein
MNQLSSLQRWQIFDDSGERSLRACTLESGFAESTRRRSRNEANRLMELSTTWKDRPTGTRDHPVFSSAFCVAHEWRQSAVIGHVSPASGWQASRRARVGRAEASEAGVETTPSSGRTDGRMIASPPILLSVPNPKEWSSKRHSRCSAERTQPSRGKLFISMALQKMLSCADRRFQAVCRTWNLVESHQSQP